MRRLAHPFWTIVWIRAAFWAGTALTLVWAPLPASAIPPVGVGSGWGDLLFRTFEQWDADWFLRIARDGYATDSAAFFPLYPALVHGLAWVVGSELVAGTLLSLASAGAAAWALHELARPLLGRGGARDAVLCLALFPTAFVFTAVYSDGLFLALSTASFLAAVRGRSWTSGVLGGLAVGTRLIGIALLPALALLLYRRGRLRATLPLLLLPAAVGLTSLYLRHAVGDWLAWRHAQGAWERQAGALGPLTGLWWAIEAGGHGARELVFHLPSGLAYGQAEQVELWNALSLLLLAVLVWLTWVAWRRLGPAFGLYSASTLVVVLWAPSKGFPLVSLPRFALDDFPVVLALAALVQERPRLRTGLLVALGALGAVAGVAFSRATWIA